MELDPERLRLKRMEEAMEAERRSLQEDKRRLEQERAQLEGQRHGAAPLAPTPLPPQQATWSPGPEPAAAAGSKGGLFLGLAGGVLLVGVLLVAGKAWLQAKADENVGVEADAVAAQGQPPSPVVAAPAPTAPAAEDTAASGSDAEAEADAASVSDTVAAAAPATPETADASAAPDPSAAPDATAASADSGAAAPADGAATQLNAEGAVPDPKAAEAKHEAGKTVKKLSRPAPTPVKPQPKPSPAAKPSDGGLKIDQNALGEQMRKEQEKKKQLEIMGREFKKSQGK